MGEIRQIDDLVVLGRAVPELLSDRRRTVCLGGWSPTMGFVRIYPTRLETKVRRWDIISLSAERNDRDTRDESWKIAGSHDEWQRLADKIQVVGRVNDRLRQRSIVLGNLSSCVNEINEAHQSLGVIRPAEVLKTYFGDNPQHDEEDQPEQLFMFSEQFEDFEPWAKVKRDFKVEPRIKYTCEACTTRQGYHDQKILEWGFHRWMEKNPHNIEQVWENAKFGSDSHEICLFVGNQAHRRTAFLVISVLRLPKIDAGIQEQLL